MLSKVSADLTLATFGGTESTHLEWETVDDPVMGGQSKSFFKEESGRGIWEGEVKNVLVVTNPGFCTIRSPPSNKDNEPRFPDLSDTVGIEVTLREAMEQGLDHFSVKFRTSTMTEPETAYRKDFKVTAQMQSHFVPWEDFKCTWRGEESDKCHADGLQDELAVISSMGLGTYYPGNAGKFYIEIESFVARSADPTLKEEASGTSEKDGLAEALKTTRTLAMKILV